MVTMLLERISSFNISETQFMDNTYADIISGAIESYSIMF